MKTAPLNSARPDGTLPHYILAGGRSRRFGQDKARFEIEGKPMLLRVAEAFSPWSRSTTVVAQTAGVYDDLGFPTIADIGADLGPLAGLQAALQHAAKDMGTETPASGPTWILLSSCDLVQPAAAMINPLIDDIAPRHVASVYRRADLFEPFPGLYSTAALGAVDRILHSPKRSFQSLFRELGSQLKCEPLAEGQSDLDMNVPPT
ncbi:MAG: molybdenum cofactor guanylyltransferase [Planctomycetota bacterium]